MNIIDNDTGKPDDTPKTPAEETDDDILAEAVKRFRLCDDADSDNRTAALDDLAFLTGGEAQWDPKAVAARKVDGRPIITVNTLPTYLHQVTNDQRINSPSIKVHPVDDAADIDTAKVRQGMIRHIEYDSNADVAQDRGVNSAASIGFGYWRLVTEYESETSFDQKIMYRSIRNALSVRIDPLSTEPDGSDMQYAFIESVMSRDEFKRQYPNAEACNTALVADTKYAGWMTDSTVLVCEYYRIKKVNDTVVMLSTGECGFKSIMPKVLPPGVTIKKERPGTRSKVEWRKITAVDVLDSEEIKSKWIPVFPVYGDEIDIQGKVIRSGIIRNAKGPAQMYNVCITSATEEIGLRSKTPIVLAEGQDEGYEDMYAQANNRSFPVLPYKPVSLDGNLAPPPQRQPMADIPTGWLAMAGHARDNVKATTGLFDSSLGARGNATSGVQEREQQQQGDMANFHYADGLLRTLRHCGRVIDYMIPHYYDTERAVRILGEDDTADYANINQPGTKEVEGENGEMVAIQTVLNDMTGGEYDITVAAGANYSTQRQENAEFFAKAMTAAKDPRMTAIITYLAMKNQDAPGAEEAAAMLKTMLPPEAAAVLEIDKDNKQPDIMTPKGPLPVAQVPQALAELEGKLQQCQEALDKAGADKQAEAAAKAQAELMRQQNEGAKLQSADHDAEVARQIEYERLKIEETNAETARMRAETERAKAQAEADAKEAELLLAHAQLQVDAQAAAAVEASGNSDAFLAWKATLESNTRIMVAEIAARSSERKAASGAAARAGGPEKVRPQA